MLGIRTTMGKAAETISVLRSNGLLREALAKHSTRYVYFFVNHSDEKVKKLLIGEGATVIAAKETDGAKPVLEAAGDAARKGYEAFGNIAVIDGDVTDKIGFALRILSANKHIRTVIAKAGPVEGEYRLRKFAYVMGERTFIADCTENGCRFVFDVRKSFFSGKLSFERSRVCSLAKDGENVMVMFAGVGPFAIEIAKRSRRSKIVAIELNKGAYSYMLRNIGLNKTANVEAVHGDAGAAAMERKGWADRILMPLPKDALGFLDSAMVAARKGCTIHVYSFGPRESAFKDAKDSAELSAHRQGRKCRLVFQRKVRDYSASEIEVVSDILVL